MFVKLRHLISGRSTATLTLLVSALLIRSCLDILSEYGKFYFGTKRMRFSERGNENYSFNISKKGLKYLQKGYSGEYILMLLKHGSSYEALPIYGATFVQGKYSLEHSSSNRNRISAQYEGPRSCTKNDSAVAHCDLVGSRCVMGFE